VLSVSSTLQPTDTGPAAAVNDPPLSGGFAWLLAWIATVAFAVGAALLVLVVVTGNGGAYGMNGVFAMLICAVGLTMFAPAALIWVMGSLRRGRPDRRRWISTLIVAAAAVTVLAILVADVLDWLAGPAEAWPILVIGLNLVTLAAVLAAPRFERRPALAFAAVWVLLLGAIGYRAWTDFEARVVALGPSSVLHSPGLVGFTATRSGDFEVRFGASSCWEGRVIASGRYEWRPGDPGSANGGTMWVELPAGILPFRDGDLVRVCLRDGLAAATAAGVSGGEGGGFWPLD